MLPLLPPPLEIRATELANALPLIALRYGVALRAAPALADDILVARLDDASFEDVRARLAREFAAEWNVAPDGTLTLRPNAKARIEERRTSIADRRRRVIAALESLRAERDALPVLTVSDGAAYRTEMQARDEAARAGTPRPRRAVPLSPSRRLVMRLVTSLSPDEIENGEPFSREVFSTAPTPLQRPLSSRAAQAVREYVRESALFADPAENPTTPITTATVSVVRTSRTMFLQARLFDAAGNESASGSQTIGLYREEAASPTDGDKIAYAFEPTSETRDAERIFGANTRSPYGQVRAILAREPLGFGASDVLLSAARTSNRNLILHPGDDAYELSVNLGKGDLTAWLRPSAGGSASLSGSRWLDVRTGDAWLARRDFVPRTTLHRLAEAYGGRKPSLRDQVALAPLLPERGFGATAEAFVWIASGNTRLTSFSLVKFYAALSPAERSAARSGIRLGRMNADAVARARDKVFRSDMPLDRFGPANGNAQTSAWNEPTTLFGTPPARGGIEWNEGTLVMEEGPETIVLVPREGEPQPYPIAAIAGLVLDPKAAAKYGFDLSKLALTTRESASFHLRWNASRSGLWGVDWTLPGVAGEIDPGPYNVTTLPEQVRAELATAIERLREERDNSGPRPPPRP